MKSFTIYPAALASAMNQIAAHTPNRVWQPAARPTCKQFMIGLAGPRCTDIRRRAYVRVSREPEPLNQHLATSGSDHQFTEYTHPERGLSVLVTAMLRPEWTERGTGTLLEYEGQQYYGFWTAPGSRAASVYRVGGETEPLVRLHTAYSSDVWLMATADLPANSHELYNRVHELTERSHARSPHPTWTNGVVTPAIRITQEGPIGELAGMSRRGGGAWPVVIGQTLQRIEIDIDGHHARTKDGGTATSNVMRGAYPLNSPLIGWTTYGTSSDPHMMFAAGLDVWRPNS